jgi:hypothetical protein
LIGHFEAPDLLRYGSGESAFLMTEKLALEKIVGNGRAVQCNKRAIVAGAEVVNCVLDELFASTGFAEH